MSDLITVGNIDTPYRFLLQAPAIPPFYGRSFWGMVHACSNPFCTCETYWIDLYPPERLDIAYRLFSLSGEANKHSFDTTAEGGDKIGAEKLADFLTPSDMKALWDLATIEKMRLIENVDVKKDDLYFAFPKEAKKVGYMYAYHDIFIKSHNLFINYENDIYTAIDAYCINFACSCTKASLSFYKNEQYKIYFHIAYDYKNGDIEAVNTKNIAPGVAHTFMDLLKLKYEDLHERMARRNQVIRDLYEKDVRKRPYMWPESPSPSPLNMAQTISRNGLCFCGSGKKYKRCHGK